MYEILKNKKIIVGVTGSISAYKSAFLVRELKKAGAEVFVIMTPSATQFITPLTLANLSRNPVSVEMFDESSQKGGAWHIKAAHECDLMIIAPCSASTIAKLAIDLCDNALVTVATALPNNIPLLVAPAMDTTMYLNPGTQRNIETLRKDSVIIIPPDEGELSSGLTGPGRLPEINILMEFIAKTLNQKVKDNAKFKIVTSIEKPLSENEIINNKYPNLQETIEKDKWVAELELHNLKQTLITKNLYQLRDKTILITAGPTVEKIDDVRFISNFSTGKMGYAIAEKAKEAGANVILISGPVSINPPVDVKVINVVSAEEMYNKSVEFFEKSDYAILAAAVSDFVPLNKVNGKIKKEDAGNELILNLVRTKDILAELSSRMKPGQKVVGFALESENEIENARKKLESKKCDMIVLNSSSKPDSGFGCEMNTITILFKNGKQFDYQAMPKSECAKVILEKMVE